MARWAIALAVLATLGYPLAGRAEEAEDAGGVEASADSGEPSGDEPADGAEASETEETPAPPQAAPAAQPSAQRLPRRSDLPGAGPPTEAGEGIDWAAYGSGVATKFLTGLNGLLTFPADPVMAAVDPPGAFKKAGYERRPLGFASGLLLMLYRSVTGTLDFALAPLPGLPVLSPVPRYKLIPGFEHEDE